MVHYKLGNRLRLLRKERNLTQKNVEEITGIKRSTIALYELDERMPTLNNLIKLAYAYHTSLDYICGIEHEKILILDNLDNSSANKINFIISENYNKNLK